MLCGSHNLCFGAHREVLPVDEMAGAWSWPLPPSSEVTNQGSCTCTLQYAFLACTGRLTLPFPELKSSIRAVGSSNDACSIVTLSSYELWHCVVLCCGGLDVPIFCSEDGGSRFFENFANDLGDCGPCGICLVGYSSNVQCQESRKSRTHISIIRTAALCSGETGFIWPTRSGLPILHSILASGNEYSGDTHFKSLSVTCYLETLESFA